MNTTVMNPAFITPRTPEDIQQELSQVSALLKQARHDASEHPALSRRVQQLTTAHALGNASTSTLAEAQAQLDAALAALPRVAALESAVATLEGMLSHAQGRARRLTCEGIESDFQARMQGYIAASKALHAQFIELMRLSDLHMGMTSRALLEAPQFKLNLPAVAHWADSPNFTTGEKLRLTQRSAA